MWKYQCKKQLGIIAIMFVIGALFFGLSGMIDTKSLIESAKTYGIEDIIYQSYFPYLFGGIFFAGAMNVFMLFMYIVQKYRISFLLLLIIFIVGGVSLIVPLGILTLFPTIAVCIYGWFTIPNKARSKELHKKGTDSVKEIERIYRCHHAYLNEYEELAKKCRDATLRLNLSYIIGLLVIFLFVMYINNIVWLLVVFVLYAFLYFQLTRKKTLVMEPIISLLYKDCNPEACASALFAYARMSFRKSTFAMPQHLAQCMIYLNDSHLAIDIMVSCERNKSQMQLAYFSTLAYAYYQLGDQSNVERQLEDCKKTDFKGNAAFQMMKQQCMQVIQNKLDLMQQNFREAQMYLENTLKESPFVFQKVDAHYYLGLIAYVEKDFMRVKQHFQFVKTHANTMYFKEKANGFLKKVSTYDKDSEDD